MYTVIFSTDPFLLARLSTDLMMEGFAPFLLDVHPFEPNNRLERIRKFLKVYPDNIFTFNGMPLIEPKEKCKQVTLTESNYLDTLKFLIENKKP